MINLRDFIGCLQGEHDAPQVDEHGQTHGIHELVVALGPRAHGALVGIQQYGVPDGETADKAELSAVQTSNPTQQEGLGLNVLQFECPIQLYVQYLEFIVLQLTDALQDGRIILGVGINDPFDSAV